MGVMCLLFFLNFINLRNVVTTWVLFDYALAEIEKSIHVPRARHRSCGHEKISV